MITILLIDGVKKLVHKIKYSNKKENVLRIYSLHDCRVPEKVLFESKEKPGTYLDETTDKLYLENQGRIVGI